MQDTAVQYFSSIAHIFIGLWGGDPISVELSKWQTCSGRLASIFVGWFSCNVLANARGRAAQCCRFYYSCWLFDQTVQSFTRESNSVFQHLNFAIRGPELFFLPYTLPSKPTTKQLQHSSVGCTFCVFYHFQSILSISAQKDGGVRRATKTACASALTNFVGGASCGY